MAYEIIWTAEAETDLFNIMSYLKDNWSAVSAEKFIDNCYLKIERLSKMPSLGRTTPNGYYRYYKIDKKNVLFFEVKENHLILLSIYPYLKDISKSKYY